MAQSLVLMVGSTALGHLMVLATLPLVGRLYLPADLGQLGTFLAFLGVASVGTSLRYDILIVASETEAEGAALLAGVCWLTVPLAIIWSGGLALLIDAGWLGFEVLPIQAALWMFPALVATQLFFAVRYWLMRGSEFAAIARATVWQNVFRAVMPLPLFLIGGGWIGLVASEIAARLAGLTALIRRQRQALMAAIAGLAPGDVRRAFAAYPESAWAGFPSSIINAAANALALPLIGGTFGAAAAGYFALVQRALLMPMSLIGRNVADVFHARLADHARTEPEAARGLFLRTALYLLAVGGVPSLIALVAGRWLLVFAMGVRWQPAADLLVAMIPWTLAMFVVSPLSRVVVVYRGQVAKLIYDLVSLVALLVVLWWGPRSGWSLVATVWALSLSQGATYVVYFLVLLGLICRAASSSAVLAQGGRAE